MKKKLFLICFGLAIIIVSLAASNLFIPSRPLSLDDLLVRWLILPGRFFIPELNPGGRGPEQELRINPELVRLNNKPRHFNREKAPGVFRIFCIGGSTTQGWPFQHVLSYPDLLGLELKDVLPNRRIEVINAGVVGSDSFSDIPLLKQLLQYDPNLILIYEGRNEPFHAPLHLGFRAKLLIPHFWLLLHLHLYRYLRYWISPNPTFTLAAPIRKWAGQSLPANYKDLTRRQMLENLTRMIHLARRGHCTVMLITQVRDFRDPEDNWLKDYNNSIRRLAAAQHVPVIDASQAFRSYHGGSGPIFLSYLWHPDMAGYFLIAQTAARSLARSGLLAPAKDWRWRRQKSELDYLRARSVTPQSLGGAYTFLSTVCLNLRQGFHQLPILRNKYKILARQYERLAVNLKRKGWTALPRY